MAGDDRKAIKLLGHAELHGDRYRVRLSRKADPSHAWIDLKDPTITEAQAREAAHEMSLTAIAKGLGLVRHKKPAAPGAAKRERTDAYAERWMADREAREIVVNARFDGGHLREHVFPLIGETPIAEVTREQIEGIVSSLDAKIVAGTIAHKTGQNVWGTVSKMFDDAQSSKNLKLRARAHGDDPTLGVKPPERGEDKTKQFLYPSEYLQLVTADAIWNARGKRTPVARFAQRWMRVFTLAIYTQLREGELRALRWEDLDLDRWLLKVKRATKRDTGGKKTKVPKSGVGRTFDIEPALRPLLLAMWHEAKAALPEGTTPTGVVIAMPHESDLSERLKRYLQWAGIRRAELFVADRTQCAIVYRDLRATGITWRAIRGDESLRIQRAAGHKELSTTQIYIRTAEDLGGQIGGVFPEIPACVIGSGPNLVPIEPEFLQAAEMIQTKSVPSGIRTHTGAINHGDLIGSGPKLGPDVQECPPLPPGLIHPNDPILRALISAADGARRAGQWADWSTFAGEIAARIESLTAPNVVALPSPRARKKGGR